MFFTVLFGLLAAVLLIPFGIFFRGRSSVLLSLIPLALFCWFCQFISPVAFGEIVHETTSWVPSLNIDLTFRLDGLSLLFSLLITGIGTLIFFYASSYLRGHQYLDRFYAYLLLFMSAMLGIVLSENILLLFIFWELTSISSFFLIGFNTDSAESRKSALLALSITGLGGFFLLAGLILVSQIGGSYLISELIEASPQIITHDLYPLAMVFVLIGAFTKSAQFPFHFWLPGAMKAPTPVSAYLHSATMVKAGVFLLARFTPVLGGTELWTYCLLITGGFTMVYAAVHALFRTDLKSVLAYSTIAVLGMLIFLIGLGTPESLIAAVTFILVHAFYKAAMFMITGIIDHSTGTRDLLKLSGLRKTMMPVFIAGILVALSSAGMPLFLGFIGKDLVYEATLHYQGDFSSLLTGAAMITNVCLVAAGLMAGLKPFTGSLPEELQHIHKPEISVWMPPLLLGALGLVFGILPGLLGEGVVNSAVYSISRKSGIVDLKIWHGFNLVLILSLTTLVAGAIVYLLNQPSAARLSSLARFERFSPQQGFSKLGLITVKLSEWYTGIMHNGFLRSYLIKIIIFAELILLYGLVQGGPIYIDYSKLTSFSLYEVVCVLVLLASVVLTIKTSSRLTAVVATSVIGYSICLIYVFYSAPDLAMTQFTIDTLTVVLFVFVLFNLPSFLVLANRKVIIRDSIVAVIFGLLLSAIAVRVLQIPTETVVSDYYGRFAYTLAKGKNVVNVILVDFRGFDTMFEIVVLSIAAIGVYGLIKLRLKSSEKE